MTHSPRASKLSPQTRRHARLVTRILRRWWWRTRYLAAATLLGLAAVATIAQFRPEASAGILIVTSARDIPAGTELAAADLARVEVPRNLVVPQMMTDTTAALGRRALVPIPRGLPVYLDLFSDGTLTAQAPVGSAVVPIRLDPAAAELLRPGDHIDLLISTAGNSWDDDPAAEQLTYLAKRALVLADAGRFDAAATGGAGLLNSGSTASGERITLVAVTAAEAPRLSTIALTGSVAAVLVP